MVKRSSILATVVAFLIVAIAHAACSPSKPSPEPGEETFASTIEPLVREKCQACHHQGGIAPFGLVTYDEVRAVGGVAKLAVTQRKMPPWGPFDDATCANTRAFKGDLSLTQAQIDTFSRWVDHGMPRGDTSQIPTSTTHPIGLVDKTHTFEVAAPYMVEPGAKDELRCFTIDPGFKEDTWIGESIVIPGDPRVVHHAIVYLDPDREGIKKSDSTQSYPCFGGPELKSESLLLAWSPAGTSTRYGDDAGALVPKNAHLVMQVHYHPIATSVTGRTTIELKALPQAPAHAAAFILLGNADGKGGPVKLLPGPNDPTTGPAFLIPANTRDHVESMEYVSPVRATVAAVGAHMHWAGVGMKLQVERKVAGEGEPETDCLLNTSYDFNWQRTYTYDLPLDQAPHLGSGDKLRITCTYDNTEDNPHIARVTRERRMSTPPEIRLGGNSTDEMCQAILVLIE